METLKYILFNDGREMVVNSNDLEEGDVFVETEWDDWDNCYVTKEKVEVLNMFYLHVSASLCFDEKGSQMVDYYGYPEYSYSVCAMDNRGNVLYSEANIKSALFKYVDYDDERLENEVMRSIDWNEILIVKN